MGVGGQCHAPAALLPAKRSSSHCTGDWVGLRAGAENLFPPGFDPLTIQLVRSWYTDYTIQARKTEYCRVFLG